MIIANTILNNRPTDIWIKGNTIERIADHDAQLVEQAVGEEVIDGTDTAAFPSFGNAHTHAAMSLFRGFGDDLPLQEWLTTKIWPNEAHLDGEICYWGAKLACLEMIKSGTTAFNDMYFYLPETAQAVNEMGLRATLGITGFDFFDNAKAEELKQLYRNTEKLMAEWGCEDSLIRFCAAPHAIYTVSGPTLRWISDWAREHDALYHIHLSETEQEVTDCINQHGLRPVQYLQQQGVVIDNRFIAAHALWLDPTEIDILGQGGATVVHNPNSNLKLGSGHAFQYTELKKAGCNVAFGTDGCSSSNNLDMVEATKTASLLQKGWRHDTTTLPAQEALQAASRNGMKAMRINAGEIAVGMQADILLADLRNIAFIPRHSNITNNFVYAAHGDCVKTLIGNGRVLMRDRVVPGEEEIFEQIARIIQRPIEYAKEHNL